MSIGKNGSRSTVVVEQDVARMDLNEEFKRMERWMDAAECC